MRRIDRQVTELPDILGILDKCQVMRVGLSDGLKPYVVPMNFAYEVIGEELFLYSHCAPVGRKMDILTQNNNVCFEADCSYRTIPGEKACDWSAEYESVIGEGTISIVSDEAGKSAALDLLMKRCGFEGTPSYSPQALSAVEVLCIAVGSITGKRNIAKP